MKRALKILAVLLLIAAIVGGAGWYFLSYNPASAIQVLTDWGESAAARQQYTSAIRYYRWAYALSDEDTDIALALAESYAKSGNYTKAEYTLVNAISASPSVTLYEALCHIYVEQDKLLDAVTMLNQIEDPDLKAQLSALRPAAPTASHTPGYYSEYIDVALQAESGTLYVTTDGSFPSLHGQVYEAPISLGLGETTIGAIAVSEEGFVSDYAIFGYTVGGVVESVTLQDAALDAYVRELLNKGSASALMTSDLWSIQEMTIPAEVQNLSDLAYFTSLTSLTIEGQAAGDFSFLSSLTSLTSLNLSGSTVTNSDLEAIGGLSQLTELKLTGCGLSNIAGLSGCAKLQTLDLSDNSINDISPLASCTALQSLNLQRNALTRLDSLSGLTALTSLDVSQNSITSIAPICGNVQLATLDVSNNHLNDLANIGRLTNLTTFSCAHNNLVECDQLAACVNLVTLDISNNEIESMDALVSLVNVRDMNVSYNNNRSIPDFPDDCALVNFNGEHNFFEDVSGLADLENLNNAYFDYNNISDVNCLAGCPNLISVSCFNTNVADVSQLTSRDVIVNYNPL